MSAFSLSSPGSDNVLIVDTDAAVCETVAVVAKSYGYAPTVCLDVETALASTQDEGYGLAFIEVGLPGTSGLGLAALLRERGGVGDLVFMSGGGSLDSLIQAIKLGSYDFLRKPFGLGELRLLFDRHRERADLKRRVRLVERRHTSLIQNLPLLIYSLTRSFQLEFINEASKVLLGYAPDEALSGEDWFLQRIHPHDRDRLRDQFAAAFAEGGAFSLECRLLHRRGQVVHGIMRTIPAQSVDGVSVSLGRERVQGVFMDITDRVFLEKALIQNEKLKTLGAISAEVAHEVRNPLMSIAGFARRLAQKLPDTPELGIILRESRRLERLLDRIREYLRPVEVSRRQCAVNMLLADCVSLLFPEMDEKNVWCQVDLEEGLPPVMGDPDALRQVFINLCRNAIHALQSGDVFGLKSYTAEHSVHVEWRNRVARGEDLNPELLFMPFDQGGESFGLPLCHRLVKNMGGLLTFHVSEGEAVFTVSLPRVGEAFELETLAGDEPVPQDKSCFDADTGTLNSVRFRGVLDRVLLSSARSSRPMALLLSGLDDAKVTQDGAEEPIGREILAAVAGVLSEVLKDPRYLLALFKDNLFAAILPNTSREEAETLARTMCDAVAGLDPHAVVDIPSGGSASSVKRGTSGRLSLSVGVVGIMPDPKLQASDLLDAAARALDVARRAGRGHVFALDTLERN